MVHFRKGNQTVDGPHWSINSLVTHILQNILFYVFMFLVARPAVKKKKFSKTGEHLCWFAFFFYFKI